MSTPTYPMRRALHLRLEAGLDDLEIASGLHGVAVDRLRCFELGEVELTPRELSELADQFALHSSWQATPTSCVIRRTRRLALRPRRRHRPGARRHP